MSKNSGKSSAHSSKSKAKFVDQPVLDYLNLNKKNVYETELEFETNLVDTLN